MFAMPLLVSISERVYDVFAVMFVPKRGSLVVSF